MARGDYETRGAEEQERADGEKPPSGLSLSRDGATASLKNMFDYDFHATSREADEVDDERDDLKRLARRRNAGTARIRPSATTSANGARSWVRSVVGISVAFSWPCYQEE